MVAHHLLAALLALTTCCFGGCCPSGAELEESIARSSHHEAIALLRSCAAAAERRRSLLAAVQAVLESGEASAGLAVAAKAVLASGTTDSFGGGAPAATRVAAAPTASVADEASLSSPTADDAEARPAGGDFDGVESSRRRPALTTWHESVEDQMFAQHAQLELTRSRVWARGGKPQSVIPSTPALPTGTSRRWEVACDERLYSIGPPAVPQCTPAVPAAGGTVAGARCARVLRDGFLSRTEQRDMIATLERAMRGLFHQGAQTSFAPEARSSLKYMGAAGHALFQTVSARVRASLEADFGAERLHPAGALFTRIWADHLVPADGMDVAPGHAYDGPHVDKANRASYDYSALLYLNTKCPGGGGGGVADCVDEDAAVPTFDGGDFAWLDEDRDLVVQPRGGRLLGFTGGLENLHHGRRVTNGTRYLIGFWFTCHAELEYADDQDDEEGGSGGGGGGGGHGELGRGDGVGVAAGVGTSRGRAPDLAKAAPPASAPFALFDRLQRLQTEAQADAGRAGLQTTAAQISQSQAAPPVPPRRNGRRRDARSTSTTEDDTPPPVPPRRRRHPSGGADTPPPVPPRRRRHPSASTTEDDTPPPIPPRRRRHPSGGAGAGAGAAATTTPDVQQCRAASGRSLPATARPRTGADAGSPAREPASLGAELRRMRDARDRHGGGCRDGVGATDDTDANVSGGSGDGNDDGGGGDGGEGGDCRYCDGVDQEATRGARSPAEPPSDRTDDAHAYAHHRELPATASAGGASAGGRRGFDLPSFPDGLAAPYEAGYGGAYGLSDDASMAEAIEAYAAALEKYDAVHGPPMESGQDEARLKQQRASGLDFAPLYPEAPDGTDAHPSAEAAWDALARGAARSWPHSALGAHPAIDPERHPRQAVASEHDAGRRQDCGFAGITEDECVHGRGCQWDDSGGANGEPWCFF